MMILNHKQFHPKPPETGESSHLNIYLLFIKRFAFIYLWAYHIETVCAMKLTIETFQANQLM